MIGNRPPLWAILFGSSVVLFLAGAASFAASGTWHTALAGLVGALLAALVIVLFSGKGRPPLG